ncbi:hypothetical protein NN561_020334 [Cricetulus griseus]
MLADRGGAWPRPRVTLTPRREASRPEPGLPDIAASSSRTATAGSVARGGSQRTSHQDHGGIAARAAEMAQPPSAGKSKAKMEGAWPSVVPPFRGRLRSRPVASRGRSPASRLPGSAWTRTAT